MYLRIQNPGVCPVEGMTTMGLSGTRDAAMEDKRLIARFGTGNKHGILTLLRHEISPIIFCGSLKLDFFTEGHFMDDEINPQHYQRIFCRTSGKYKEKSSNRKLDLNCALDLGAMDWTDISMALREFVSNSLDFTTRKTGNTVQALKDGEVLVDVVSDNQVRAKEGYTRYYVPLTPEVRKFHEELPKWFLHFREPYLLEQSVLPKRGRNFSSHHPAMIYRRGVFVAESPLPSLYDYNINDLTIDECRNADGYDLRTSAAKVLANSSAEILSPVFEGLIAGNPFWESTFDTYTLTGEFEFGESESDIQNRQKNWKAAWESVVGQKIIIHDDDSSDHLAETIEKKGFSVAKVKSYSWVDAAKKNTIPSAQSVLSRSEAEGVTKFDANSDVIWALDIVWDFAQRYKGALNLREMEKPAVHCFTKLMDAEAQQLGYYCGGEIGIHRDIGARSRELLKVMFEEVSHHITQAGDSSRDLQDFLFRWITEITINQEGLSV